MRRSALFPLPALVLLVVFVLPLVLGSRTLFMRDIFNSHLPQKYSHAEALREGYLPLVDPHRGAGQAALGNPNGALLYPDNLLLLELDPLWVVNLRFWLHWLVAPLAFFWLCRRLGLDARSSWAGGLLYATSGHFLSQLNFYNLIAGVALTPALIAAVLEVTRRENRRSSVWAALGVAILWCLLILSGDPMTALQAFVLAMLAWLLSGHFGFDRKRDWPIVVTAFLAGTLLAAPQWLEFQKILALSYRGHWGFSPEWALQASWDPRRLAEWFLPMIFGRPDLGFWGARFHDDNVPLFFSLYPGLLLLSLMVFSGTASTLRFFNLRHSGRETSTLDRARLFSWLSIAGGLFFALGRWNPVVSLLVEGGSNALRFPVKFWLPVALGMALLAAIGFARTLSTEAVTSSRTLSLFRLLIGAAVVYALLFVTVQLLGPQIESLVAGLMPPGGPPQVPGQERLRYGGLTFLTAVFLLGFAALVFLSRRRPLLGSSLLLALHVASQLFFLQPLLVTDEVAVYREEPPLLKYVGDGELVVQACTGKMFGKGESPTFAGPELKWMQRLGWAELYPFVGTEYGVHYDLNVSPEGLDSFLTMTTMGALEILNDVERLRLLRAVGVDLVVLNRRLDPEAESQVRLRAHLEMAGAGIYLYQLEHSAREVELVGNVYRAVNLNDSLARLLGPAFDPRVEAVLPGEGGMQQGEPGLFEVLSQGPESIRVATSSQDPSVLVWRRTFLPLYRATVDGEEVRVRVANQTRIGIELEPGEHDVHIYADRSRLTIGLWMALLGALLLPLVGWLGLRRSRDIVSRIP